MAHRNTTLSVALFCGLLQFPSTASHAQVFNDIFDGAGNETYTGVNGFGPFNWVNALNYGFATQHGNNAFLSNYTGQPIPNIGMVKPFATTMDASTYRVAFYCSRYSSANTLALADYDTLYIGSPDGTMVWDTVPTPTTNVQWVRWSGLYTPAPSDIGQPFKFGFSITLFSGTSFALDGPVTATDLSTGITARLDEEEFSVVPDPASATLQVRASSAIAQVEVFDARGGLATVHAVGNSTTTNVPCAGMSSGLCVVRVRMTDGTLRSQRVVLP